MSVKSRDQPGVFPHKKTRTETRDDKDSIGRNRYRILYHVVINTTCIDCTFCTGIVITKEPFSTSFILSLSQIGSHFADLNSTLHKICAGPSSYGKPDLLPGLPVHQQLTFNHSMHSGLTPANLTNFFQGLIRTLFNYL